MYKKILCAIELGDEGAELITRAKQLAQLHGADLFVLHVLPYSLLPVDYQKVLIEQAIPEFDAMMQQCGIEAKQSIVKVGKPYQVICHQAKIQQTNLILIGTHSKKGVHALLGSTASAVANHAHCDVSLVRLT